MNLPDLALQIVYGRLAWALVASALLLSLLPTILSAPRIRRWTGGLRAVGQRTRWLIVAAIFVAMALPGTASPAYWLTLALQYPGGLLVGCSAVSLLARWRRRPVRFTLPAGLALALSVIGLVIYLDTFGILALGLYYGGFNPVAAPLLACAAAIGFAVNVWRGGATGPSAAMLIAVLLFSLLRLPTGNLWDALLDPLLWSWALGSTVVACMRLVLARRAPRAAAPTPEPELVPVRAAGGE
ncbi:MAG: hypothetical protein ABW069_11155 [Duganella sp.]